MLTKSSADTSISRLSRSMTVLREKAPHAIETSSDTSSFAKTLPMFVAGHGLGQNDIEIFYNLDPKAESFTSPANHV